MEQRQAEPAPDAVVIDRLACLRGGRLVFEQVDWRIARGTLGLLTGPNGAGKSTLLRIIAGLLRPAAGSIMVDGRVALADERRALDPLLTLRQALRFWAAMDAQSSTATDMVLESLGLAALADVPVRMLSTGQTKRAVVARTLQSGADIMLLDEPMNGLDKASAALMATALAAQVRAGTTLVLASHIPIGIEPATTLDMAI